MTTLAVPAAAIPVCPETSMPVPVTGPVPVPVRPAFHQRNTQDRLREGAGLYIAFLKGTNNLQKNRRSVFKETGLDDAEELAYVACAK
ncbi:hypothetical protein ESCO_005532 [Escovopsis weberi]|uniref:Uncharacterized protein n=1 Tax=Escovopsis weberi TaxID=150374 RepID=A0A0M9VV48_ESCWE|nr:hypothetical protein ESCO_005532 [Escovopsis weberi]